jgi:hypothetical protein
VKAPTAHPLVKLGWACSNECVRPDGSPSRKEEDAGRRERGEARSGFPQWSPPWGALRSPAQAVPAARRGVRGEHAVIPMARCRGGVDQDRQLVEESPGVRGSAVCPRWSRLGESVNHCSPLDAHAKRCILGPRPGPVRVPSGEGLDADPGVQGEGCPELVEGLPPWSHRRISAGAFRMSPGRAKTRFKYDTPLFYKGSHWLPSSRILLSTVFVPPPFTQGQPLSVAFFLWYPAGLRGVREGLADFADRPTGASAPGFALLGRFFSPGRPGACGRSPQAGKDYRL